MSLFQPRANIYKADNQFIIDVFLPGVSAEDLNLEVRNHRLIVEASRQKNEKTIQLKRQFQLNRNIEVDLIDANLENGLLRVSLPVANHQRKITVNAA